MLPFYDEEHRQLGDELRSRVSSIDWPDDPVEVVGLLGELGVFPLLGPEKSVRALCVAREVLAYASPMADAIFAVQGLASHPLGLSGADGWHEYLAEVTTGQSIGGFALTEPEAGSDVASMRAVARRDGDRWRLDGEKTLTSNPGIPPSFPS